MIPVLLVYAEAAMHTDEEEVIRLVISMAEEKEEEAPLHITGLENIHPLYEALIALLRQNLDDATIAGGFARSPESLRDVLVIDGLLPFLRQHQRKSLEGLLSQGKPLKEVLEYGALLLAEERRIADGNVVRCAAGAGHPGYFFMATLPAASPQHLFLSN